MCPINDPRSARFRPSFTYPIISPVYLKLKRALIYLDVIGSGCPLGARTIDHPYRLRIAYAGAYPNAIDLVDHDLVDQENLKENFLLSERAHSVSSVLDYAIVNRIFKITSFLPHTFAEDRQYGIHYKLPEWSRRDKMKSWLQNGPLLGTMIIKNDYQQNNLKVYMGDGHQNCGYHTVVILGVEHLSAREAAQYGCSTGMYFVYQDSQGPRNDDLLGKGRNLGHIKVLLKIYDFSVALPNELLPPL